MELKKIKSETNSAAREAFLREIIHLTAGNDQKDSILQILAAKIGSFFNADRVYIFNYNQFGHLDLDAYGSYNNNNISPLQLMNLPFERQILMDPDPKKNVQQVFNINDLAQAPLRLQRFLKMYNVTSFLVYEIFYKGKPNGRFVMQYCKKNILSDEEILLLESILHLITHSIFERSLLIKEQETRLKAQNLGEELQQIIDSIPAFISFVTPDLKFKYYNKMYSEFFGISDEDIHKKEMKDIIGEKPYRISGKMMKRVLEGEKVTFENEVIDKKGRKRNVHVQYLPNRDNNGIINGFFVLGNDVTEIKSTEHRLEEKRERLRLAIESTNLGTWDHNFVTGEIEVSQRTRELLGFDENEDITHKGFLNKICEEDREKVKKLLENIIMDEQQDDYHMVFRTLHEKWIKAYGRLFVDSENRNIRFIGLIEDITEQKKYETYLQKQQAHFYEIFNEAPSLIFVLKGKDFIYEYVNNAFLERYHHINVIGKKFESVFPELIEQGFGDLLNKVYYSGKNVTGKEVLAGIVSLSTGELREGYFNYLFHPTFDANDKVEGVVVYANDITDQVKSRKLLESFLSIASHELKTPLTSVMAYTELMAEELANENSRLCDTYMPKMVTNLKRLRNLINDLLDVSRIQSGKFDYNFHDLSYKKFIEGCIENLKMVYPKHNFHVSINSENFVHADRERLEQVISNLISNAVKYAPGKNEIYIEVKDHKKSIVTSVTDNGFGIPLNKQKELFQKFFRLESEAFKSTGLGIGLYISKEIINVHKGEIGVKSNPGKGSTFYFKLPIVQNKT